MNIVYVPFKYTQPVHFSKVETAVQRLLIQVQNSIMSDPYINEVLVWAIFVR